MRAIGPVSVLGRVRPNALFPHPEEPRSGVSKDEGPCGASWFETALVRLLTMRVVLLAYLQNLDAGQGFPLHPFKKRAARGRDIGEIAGHPGLVQRRHRVAAAGDRSQLPGPGALGG